MDKEDWAHVASLHTLEKIYESYEKNPKSVDKGWGHFFSGMEFASQWGKGEGGEELKIQHLINNYRRWGFRQAHLDPLDLRDQQELPILQLENCGFQKEERKKNFPTLGLLPKKEAPLEEIEKGLKKIYCQSIGVEYMDLDHLELEKWIQKRIEPFLHFSFSPEEKIEIWKKLKQAEMLERFLQTQYGVQTRFSSEGVDTIIPMLSSLVDTSSEKGCEEVVFAIAHRARLNVIGHILQKSYGAIFYDFEEFARPCSAEGEGDIKYHKGFSSIYTTPSGKTLRLHLEPNPSHLESIDPVVLGEVKGKQISMQDEEKIKVLPVLIHGDAAFSGQGVVYETQQMMNLSGYDCGGTIHIILNNQIGFTASPEEGRSTLYCSDLARAFRIPVFHVNAQDPEAAVYVTKMALDIRNQFHCDVIIDLVGYRKYGHNEGDEPSLTQPIEYKKIHSLETIQKLYLDQLLKENILSEEKVSAFEEKLKEDLKKGLEKAKSFEKTPPTVEEMFGSVWSSFPQGEEKEIWTPFNTAVEEKTLLFLAENFHRVPEDVKVHPKLKKWLHTREEKIKKEGGGASIDWAMSESLAFGSILEEKISVRLIGQDSPRGTFSQRHNVWVDYETGKKYYPLHQFAQQNTRFDVISAPLSEYGALGFEYGYSWSDPNVFVLWEAQYGDFFNGGQIIIDQYISSAETKWNRYSSLTLLLPHGYEGAGPEHSSARIERFLQSCAEENMQVVYPTVPSQYFHLLRRQALRKCKKPLIVFTPKSLLRYPGCVSPLSSFSQGGFEEILPDEKGSFKATKLLFCTGKIYFELMEERKKKNREDVAIIRIEQLYPFHKEKVKKIVAEYKGYKECSWVQEEPQNMGAWEFIYPQMEEIGIKLSYTGRKKSASPSTGYHIVHKEEQAAILEEAFRGN